MLFELLTVTLLSRIFCSPFVPISLNILSINVMELQIKLDTLAYQLIMPLKDKTSHSQLFFFQGKQ